MRKPNFESNAVKMQVINGHLNFGKALLCSSGFLLLYTALYSAQNVQSVLF
jgi:MFS family permease